MQRFARANSEGYRVKLPFGGSWLTRGGYAVMRVLKNDLTESTKRDGWTVTHIESGVSVIGPHYLTLVQARQYCRLLAEAAPFAPVSGPEDRGPGYEAIHAAYCSFFELDS